MSACLVFGFSRSLTWAIASRSLAGASSGTVGIIRTMVAEMVPERELQPKAFSIMPLVWCIGMFTIKLQYHADVKGAGSIIGPILGGALANPSVSLPVIFGGVYFFEEFPFALPNLVASLFFIVGIASGYMFLRETLETRKHDRDYGRIVGRGLVRCFKSRRRNSFRRKELDTDAYDQSQRRGSTPKPPSYREVFSYQSNLNLFVYTLLALHSVAFDQLISVFLHTRLAKDREYSVASPLKFAGGFGLSVGIF